MPNCLKMPPQKFQTFSKFPPNTPLSQNAPKHTNLKMPFKRTTVSQNVLLNTPDFLKRQTKHFKLLKCPQTRQTLSKCNLDTPNCLKMPLNHAKMSQKTPQTRQTLSKGPSNTPNCLKRVLKHVKVCQNALQPHETLKIPLNHTRLPKNCV